MPRLQRLKMFLNFWYAPYTPAKSDAWDIFTGGMTLHLDTAIEICRDILKDRPEMQLHWVAIESLDAESCS